MRYKALFIAFLMFITGCAEATTSNFLLPSYTVNNINCIAVLPPENTSQNPDAGNIIADILSIGVMHKGGFDVMDRMEVERVLKERGIYMPNGIAPDNAANIGRILGVQAVFAGTVSEYRYKPSSIATEGADPVASFSLSLIDTATGQTIWSGKGNFSASGMLASGTEPLTNVAQDGVESLLDDLYDGIGARAHVPQRVCWYDPNVIFARVMMTPQPPPQQQVAVAAPAPQVQQTPVQQRIQVPPAKVSILNASGNKNASTMVGFTLIKNKINVVNVSVQRGIKPRSIIYYKPYYYEQALHIGGLLKIMPELVQSGAYSWDITLIIGRDLR
ncbi:MAG: DUF799 family lipoprotein [Deltaproteobacteria bacterium]|nr:DUF799 family lipoprotein [Deltaproteobacteria bacterium]MCL5792760.1 DUF799 family lipoprotein [Deltaproteobacteria bacterium]